jgi:hypothetical protein
MMLWGRNHARHGIHGRGAGREVGDPGAEVGGFNHGRHGRGAAG